MLYSMVGLVKRRMKKHKHFIKETNHFCFKTFSISGNCWGLIRMSPLRSRTGFSMRCARHCRVEIIKLDKCGDSEQLNIEAGIGGSKKVTINREIVGSAEWIWATRKSLPSSIMMKKTLLELDNVNARLIVDWIAGCTWNWRVLFLFDCEIRRQVI